MSSIEEKILGKGTAESDFREAFERLKNGRPTVLPFGSKVTQNNVAKEAGRDASALKKARYPNLILEIQQWVSSTGAERSIERGAKQKKSGSKEEKLNNLIVALKRDRDIAQSLLLEAHAKILELTQELSLLRDENSDKSNVIFL